MSEQTAGDHFLAAPVMASADPRPGTRMPHISTRTIALVLLLVGLGLAGLGLLRGLEGLQNLDGVPCPAVLGEDRLVTVLTGKDPECDATRAAQRVQLYWLFGSSAVALAASLAAWSAARRQRL